jgi:hypothetical protein
MQPSRISAIDAIKLPKTKTDVRSFLGMAGYYRTFIRDFTGIASPLHNALRDENPTEVQATTEFQESFQLLKQKLREYPILRFPDFNEPFILETDASVIRLAAALMQDIEGQRVLISCAGKTLTPAQKNYSPVELEAFAVVWGISYFRPYLFGRNFTVITDHESLKYLYNFQNPTGKIVRWILSLQEYSFEVIYRSGKKNVVADAISRLNMEPGSLAICSLQVEDRFQPEEICELIRKEQKEDKFCSDSLNYLQHLELTDNEKWNTQIITWARFMLVQDGLLYHLWTCNSDKRTRQCIKQLVVPKSLKDKALRFAHCEHNISSHLGMTKSFEKLRWHFFWLGMYTDLIQFIQKCETCQKLKNPSGKLRIRPSSLARPVPNKPWDIVSTDVLHLPESSNSFKYIILFVDNFSRCLEAHPLVAVNGQAVSNVLIKEVVCRHGCPVEILCDNATYYVKAEVSKVCDFYGIKLSPVSKYHPQANGIAESKVKILKSLLRSLVKQKSRNWDEFLHFATFAFNTSFNARIGHTPYFVSHGYEANLPGKLPMFLLNHENQFEIPQDISPYCNDLFAKTQFCHQLVQSNLEKANEKHSKIEDMPEYFEVNEFVWLFNPVSHIGVHPSFKTYWEGPFTVIQKKSPVLFKIQKVDDPENIQTVYASRLKPCFL